MNKILQSIIIYKDGKLQRIIVLVDFTSSSSKPYSDVRAICATDNPSAGYMWLTPKSVLNEELLQEVASYGFELHERDKVFPKWRTIHK